MKEIWKDVPGYEGKYLISESGSLYSIKKKSIMKNQHDKNGYLCINLTNNCNVRRFFIHRLVASSFMSINCKDKTVNHIDGNKKNNHISNLEYCSLKQNIIHAIDNGIIRTRKVKQFSIDGKYIATHNSIRGAARECGTYIANITRCCNGLNIHAGGYRWEYA